MVIYQQLSPNLNGKTPKESKICENLCNLWETIINPLKSIESNEESKKNRFDRGTLQCHTY